MKPNRLADEPSPYLLQHAFNPVDWYPWGEEAFNTARERDVPIFLSIGYATCYWCHVMERESFENDEIAALLNKHFVCIKVDREHRPDVDDFYMTATQLMTGHGGWPMTVFLEPKALRPFWCGTYFPAQPRHNMNVPSLPQVIASIETAWRDHRQEALDQADKLARAVEGQLRLSSEPVPVGMPQITQAASQLLQQFDRINGGFGGAPKFPQPAQLLFLLDVRAAARDDATTDAIDSVVRHTLDRMAIGGIRDQIGGGFHRYSVDATWTVPHFEKMLYDNAQLTHLYARAARVYEDSFYADITRSTAAYVLREMTATNGAFMSAQDAEVDGKEGLNYLWTKSELDDVLCEADASFAATIYSVDQGPNFRDPHHPDEPKRNVLRMADRPERIAQQLSLPFDAFIERKQRVDALLLAHRQTRKTPSTDDKAIAAWTGMMIEALVEAADVLDDPSLAAAAQRAADAVTRDMMHGSDLHRCWRGGQPFGVGLLEDHAAMIQGLAALAASSFTEAASKTTLLETATKLADRAHERFADGDGYADSPADQTDLFVRPRATYDGAVPSGTSMMTHALIDLHAASGEAKYLDRAARCARAVSPAIESTPLAVVNHVRALLRLMRTPGVDRSGFLEHDTAQDTTHSTGEGKHESPSQPLTPVEVYADCERVEVGPDAPAIVNVALRIAEGYHITAADPGTTSTLVPLRIGIVNGQGVRTFADYPKGEPLDAGPLVYQGEIAMKVVLEHDAKADNPWAGQPLLAVTFQACTDSECLQPMTIELDVAIDEG
jgi:uncharacterized protein